MEGKKVAIGILGTLALGAIIYFGFINKADAATNSAGAPPDGMGGGGGGTSTPQSIKNIITGGGNKPVVTAGGGITPLINGNTGGSAQTMGGRTLPAKPAPKVAPKPAPKVVGLGKLSAAGQETVGYSYSWAS